MRSIVAGAVAAIALLGGPVWAADLPARLPAKVMPVPVAYDWGGIYTGTTVGVGWEDINGIGFGGGTANSTGTKGWTGSVIGYQAMLGSWVLGIEGSYSVPFTSKYNHTAAVSADCSVVVAGRECNSRIDKIWTVGGKLGYAMGNWMVYGAGGYANGRIDETTSFDGVVGTGSKASHSGWYAGAGVDWYVTRIWWSDLILGLEYRHVALDSKTHDDLAGPTFNKTMNADIDMLMLKATFKWVGAGPFNAFR